MKEALIEDIEEFIAPLRERRKYFEQNPEEVLKILEDGGERARAVADEKMQEVREKIGVKLY